MLSPQLPEDWAAQVFEKADADGDGRLSIKEARLQMARFESLLGKKTSLLRVRACCLMPYTHFS